MTPKKKYSSNVIFDVALGLREWIKVFLLCTGNKFKTKDTAHGYSDASFEFTWIVITRVLVKGFHKLFHGN